MALDRKPEGESRYVLQKAKTGVSVVSNSTDKEWEAKLYSTKK